MKSVYSFNASIPVNLNINTGILKVKEGISVSVSNENIFLTVYAMFSFVSIVSSSALSINFIYQAVVLGACAVMTLLFLMRSSFTVRQIILYSVVLCIFGVAAFISDRIYLMLYALFMLASRSASFRKTVKVSMIATMSAALFVIALSLINYIPDYKYNRGGGVYAHSFGFPYYSSWPYIFFYNMNAWLYLRGKKIQSRELLILTALSYLIYRLSTVRLTFLLSVFSILLAAVMVRGGLINIKNSFIRIICSVIYPLTFCITVAAAKIYNGKGILYKLNSLLTNRLYYSHEAFRRYSVKLLGQRVEMHGNAYKQVVNDYFYIDSGYVYSIIAYGLVFSAAVLWMYSFLYRYSCRTGNKSLFVWITVIMIFTVINNTWVSLTYNPVLLLLPSVISAKRKNTSVSGG